jgi:hypothetical protein
MPIYGAIFCVTALSSIEDEKLLTMELVCRADSAGTPVDPIDSDCVLLF